MNKKSNLFFIVIVFFFYNMSVFSQENITNKKSNHTIFLELAGNTGSYSINYDNIFFSQNCTKFTFRIGFSILPTKPILILLPLEFNGLLGKSKHFFEYGLGYTPALNENKYKNLLLVRIGYRFQKREGGFFLRIGFTPVIIDIDNILTFRPWGAVGIGYCFGNK